MSFIAILFTSVALALSSLNDGNGKKDLPPTIHNVSIPGETAWKTEYKDAKILIESSTVTYVNESIGTSQERIIFRYTNLTSQKVKLSFTRHLYYNGVCYGCDKTDKAFSLELTAKEVKEYQDQGKDKTYFIFVKDLKGDIKKELDKYELLNIEITVQ